MSKQTDMLFGHQYPQVSGTADDSDSVGSSAVFKEQTEVPR